MPQITYVYALFYQTELINLNFYQKSYNIQHLQFYGICLGISYSQNCLNQQGIAILLKFILFHYYTI